MRLRVPRAATVSPPGSPGRRRTTARPGWSLWAYRSLIWNFTQRDLKARYKGTLLGWIWSLIVPLATLLIYTLVFSVIFRAEPPDFGNGEAGNFTVWLFGGLIAWNFLSQSVQLGIPTLLGSGPLLQKIYFPSYVPVLGMMGAILVQTLIELGIYAAILLLLGNVGVSWLLFPVWLAIYLVFVAAVAIGLAAVNVYFRDIQHLTGVALQLVFFLTPIIYPVTLVPADWNGLPLQQLIMLNPVSQFVVAFRELSYGLVVPSLWTWLVLVAWAAVALVVASLVYRRWGLDVGEAI
jgi:ABC-type polysaccharide/polyol phosphate export permease